VEAMGANDQPEMGRSQREGGTPRGQDGERGARKVGEEQAGNTREEVNVIRVK